jgi:hypothetical protein
MQVPRFEAAGHDFGADVVAAPERSVAFWRNRDTPLARVTMCVRAEGSLTVPRLGPQAELRARQRCAAQ